MAHEGGPFNDWQMPSLHDTRPPQNLLSPARIPGITYVSVGHRPTLVRYHEEVLQLHGGGAWTLHAASEAKLDLLGAF